MMGMSALSVSGNTWNPTTGANMSAPIPRGIGHAGSFGQVMGGVGSDLYRQGTPPTFSPTSDPFNPFSVRLDTFRLPWREMLTSLHRDFSYRAHLAAIAACPVWAAVRRGTTTRARAAEARRPTLTRTALKMASVAASTAVLSRWTGSAASNSSST